MRDELRRNFGALGAENPIVVYHQATPIASLTATPTISVSPDWFGRLPFLPMRVDLKRQTLCVDVHKRDLQRCAEYEPRAFHRYSDGDLLAAIRAH